MDTPYNQRCKAWSSVCFAFLFLLSCTTPPLNSIKDSPSAVLTNQVAEKKRQLRLSKPVTVLTSITPQTFQLKGEDEVRFDLPLSLPIIGSRIRTGSGALELSNRPPDGWHPAGLVTASASVFRAPNGDLNLNFEAGKYSGATTFYINASAVVPGNLSLKKGDTVTGNVDSNARYTISNDNGTAPLRYYAFDSGNLSATVNEDNVSVKLSGVTASKLTQVQCFSWGTGSSCDTSTDPNNKILSGEIEFIIPVTTSSLGLKLNATQDLIGNNTANESGNIATQSEISLDSLGSLKDWRIEIKKEDSESNGSPGAPSMCMTHAIVGGSGKKDKALTLDASSLGNGTYQVTAYYVDHPEEKAELTIEVDNVAEIRVIGDTTFIPLEESVQIQATYPACDSGKVQLSGSIFNDLIFEGDYSVESCSLDILAKAGGLPSETKTGTWDGSCGEAPGIDFWNADLFVGENIEDTEELELLNEILVCDSPTPVSIEDLNELSGLVDTASSSFGGENDFNIQSTKNTSIISFAKAKRSAGRAQTKLRNLGYPADVLNDLNSKAEAPAPNLSVNSNKINQANLLIDEFFAQKGIKGQAKLEEASRGEVIYSSLEQFRNYLKEFGGVDPYEEDPGRNTDFLQYKTLADEVIEGIEFSLSSPSTHSYLEGLEYYSTLLHIYMEVSAFYINDRYPSDADSDIDEYEYMNITNEKITSPLRLLNFLDKKLTVFKEKIKTKKDKFKASLSDLEQSLLSLEQDVDLLEQAIISDENDFLLLEEEQNNFISSLENAEAGGFSILEYDDIGYGASNFGSYKSMRGGSPKSRPATRTKTTTGSLKNSGKTSSAKQLYETIQRSTAKIQNVSQRLQANKQKIELSLSRNKSALKSTKDQKTST